VTTISVKWLALLVASGAVATGLLTGAPATSDGAPQNAAPPGETNGPLAYQAGSRVTITTVGTAEDVSRELLEGAPDDGEVTQFPIADAADPAWAPSGLRLAFTRRVDGRRQIFLTSRDEPPKQLLVDPAEAFDPAWSPTGEKLAFTSTRDGHREIYVVDVNGANLQRLTPGADSRNPDWSPDGGRIAFESTRAGGTDIWTMRPDGTDALRITARSGPDRAPDWRPDGTQIAFSGRTRGRESILVVDPGGTTKPRSLTRGDAQSRDRYPSWAPDGDAIAFTRIGPGQASSTRVTDTSSAGFHDSRSEIDGGMRASWGALPAPPKDPALLDGSVVIEPGRAATISPPESTVREEVADDGARVPEGYVVRAAENDPVTLVADPASTDSPAGTSVELEVSGTFEIGQDEGDLALELVGSPLDCSSDTVPGAGGATASAAKKPKPKKKLSMKGKGKGHGPKAVSGDKVGIDKGTDWSVEETCAGTIFSVTEGAVLVEYGRNLTHLVSAGEDFLVPRG